MGHDWGKAEGSWLRNNKGWVRKGETGKDRKRLWWESLRGMRQCDWHFKTAIVANGGALTWFKKKKGSLSVARSRILVEVKKKQTVGVDSTSETSFHSLKMITFRLLIHKTAHYFFFYQSLVPLPVLTEWSDVPQCAHAYELYVPLWRVSLVLKKLYIFFSRMAVKEANILTE